MKTEFQFKIVPSDKVASAVKTLCDKWTVNAHWIIDGQGKSSSLGFFYLWIAFSTELDDTFAKRFRETSSSTARLLVFNDGHSSDTLASRLTGLQLRSSHRFYVADVTTEGKSVLIGHFLERLASILEANDDPDRIFDAKIENGILRVVSPDFRRIEVPISKIPEFKNAGASKLTNFKIDKDGSFIFWPELDVHLGWAQFEQIVNPEAVRKARQKSREFNVRYGQAVREIREQAGIGYAEIRGISEKQIRRIEDGACRLTTNALQILSEAHGLSPNDYLQLLANSMSKKQSPGDLDGRERDKDGQIREKRGGTLVGTLRKEYGNRFAKGYRADTKLETLRNSTGKSLSDPVKKK